MSQPLEPFGVPTVLKDPVVSMTKFDAFFRSEYSAIVAVTRTICGSLNVGEEVAQEAFSRAFRDWGTVHTLDRPGAWVRRVAINLALTNRRSFSRELAALRKAGPAHLRSVPEPLPQDPLWEKVEQLPPRQRAAIVLHYQDDLPVDEIAEILDCSTSTATSHLHHARKSLAVALEKLTHEI